MSFRRRIVMLAAAAVAAAIVVASAVVYIVTGNQLRAAMDANMQQMLSPGPRGVQIQTASLTPGERARLEKANEVLARAPGGARALPLSANAPPLAIVPKHGAPLHSVTVAEMTAGGRGVQAAVRLSGHGRHPSAGGLGFGETIIGAEGANAKVATLILPRSGPNLPGAYAQLVFPSGAVVSSFDGGPPRSLPVTAAARAVAAGRRRAFFSDAKLAGANYRELTAPAGKGAVWQVALPLASVESALGHLLIVLAIVSVGGVLIAAALGLLVSRAALAPVRRLTRATERIARTQDLAHRIPAGASDELGRLALSFNTMLAALERSRLAQRQLISDASHELRTPLTSIRANLDALAAGDALSPAQRRHAVDGARVQLAELTTLMGDLIDLSKTEVQELELEEVRLDLAAAAAIRRARLHAPASEITLQGSPCLVRASPARLDRAITNLLDNAVKWSPPRSQGGTVEVRVCNGRLEVRDHGPGIEEANLPRVFDRFYRAPAARAMPGSGLGLAIVRHFAETHGGTVHAENALGGGARLTLELPALPMSAAERRLAADDERAGHEPPPAHEAPRIR